MKNSSLIILFTLLICFSQKLKATSYYVDSKAKSGGNGLSAATAFNSLSQVNNLSLKPGDNVYFNRGDVFQGMLVIQNSGSAGSPIYYGAYGSGNLPIISGATAVSNWTKGSGSAYTASCPTCPSTLTQVYVNEQLHIAARYPNAGYLTMSAVSSNGFSAPSLTNAANTWNTATVNAKTQNWIIDQFRVKNYTPGQITTNPPNHFYNSYPFQQGFGFFLTGKSICLDSASEWYFDSTSKTISIIPINAANLKTYGAQVSVYSNCIQMTNVQHITIENLQLEKSLSHAIQLQGTAYVTINNCSITQSGGDGVGGFLNYTTTNNNLTVSNSAFTNIANTGINIGSGSGVLISNNVVKRCGLVPGMGSGSDVGYEGIFCTSNSKITGNTVDSVGYTGIHICSNDSVIYNRCSYYGLTKNDCGGIYFSSTKASYIAYNIVSDGFGNGAGTNAPNKMKVNGIYSDDQSTGNTITNNTCYRNQMGMMIHNTGKTLVRYNVLYDNWESQLLILQGVPNSPIAAPYGNVFHDNVLQCLDPSQNAVTVSTQQNDVGSIGSFYSNYYCNPYTNNLISINCVPGYSRGNSTQRFTELTLKQWQTTYGYDAGTRVAYDYPSAYAVWNKQGSDQITNSLFTNSTGGWWAYGNSNFTVSLDNTNPAMNGGSLKGQYGTADTALQVGWWGTSPLSIQQGKTYLLTYSIQGETNGGMVLLPDNGNISATIPSNPTAPFTPGRTEDTLLLHGNLTATISLVFNSTSADGAFWMDNANFYEVIADTSASSPHLTSALFTNPSLTPKTILAAGVYRDLTGTLLTANVVLAPFSSVVLKKTNNPQARLVATTGVTNPNAEGVLSVYPNPVTSSFQLSGITYTGPLTISISDQLGREVYSKTGTQYDTITMPPNSPEGVYLVKISSPQYTQMTKIIYIGQ